MNEPNLNPKNNKGHLDNFDSMSHDEAATMNAVELYVLKEMSPEEEMRFEAHYFECTECAQAVAVEQALTEAVPPKPEPWWRRLALAVLIPATAALLALAAFQNFVSIPTLKTELAQMAEPQPNTVITAHPLVLGEEDGESIKTPSVTVELILPQDAASPFYRVDLLGQGRLPLSRVVPAPEGSRLSLHVSRRTLGHGAFNVLVFGLAKQDSVNGPQIEQYHFKIQ